MREAGYEALFFLGALVGTALQPSSRNLEELALWRSDPRLEAGRLKRLAERGLVELAEEGADWVPRLTAVGQAVFDGGRDVEAAWARKWDGRWHILAFDLPHGAGRARAKFWRWLRANHFGKLQGSVWIRPDAVPEIEEAMTEAGLDASMAMLFAGEVAGRGQPREIAAQAWDFGAINRAYREYGGFAERVAGQCEKKALSSARLKEALTEDRIQWWAAVQQDPLLPKSLAPRGYEGPNAWNARCRLLQKLGKTLQAAPPETG